MKHIFYFLFPVLVLLSCQKEIQKDQNRYLQRIKTSLQDSLLAEDWHRLDFTNPLLSKVDSVGLYFLRIPFKEKEIHNDFILLQTSREGKILRGRIIHLEGSQKEHGSGGLKRRTWEGSIEIRSLDRKRVLHSAVKEGYIEAFHPHPNTRMAVVPQEDVLPEIIVVAYVSPSYGISYSDWMYLQGFFYNPYDFGGGGGSTGNDYYYGSMDGSGSGYYGGGGTTSSEEDLLYDDGTINKEPLILIDTETQDENPSIDIKNFINCFNAIPDAGATCSIEIFADIPIDSDPNKILNIENGSPGHTFLQIKKSNGSQSAIQNIGFYPKNGWKTVLTNAPIDGKFVDNGGHEFNASLKMNLSPQNFNSTLTEILYLANFIKYDIDNYNCTDFALDVFNKTRISKLEIPLYDIPGNYPSVGTRTPQGLYHTLKQMRDNGNSEAVNITIGIQKGWVSYSSGPCN